jgi:hypothetical protein
MLKYTLIIRKSGDKLQKQIMKRVLRRNPAAEAYSTIKADMKYSDVKV